MRRPGLCLLLALVAAPRPALADDEKGACPAACSSLRCQLDAARCLLERGMAREAKDRLRPLAGEHADSAELYLLLARAYLELGNMVWARRVLYQFAQGHEGNCRVRAWLVWVHLKQAELDRAAELLEQPGCPPEDPALRGRWHLLRATLARYRGSKDATRAAVGQAHGVDALLPEDQVLKGWLEDFAPSNRPTPLELRAELGMGYTSNGLMSSPVDPSAPGQAADTDTPVLTLDLLARFQPPWGHSLHPVLEGSLRGLVLFNEAVRNYSYYNLGLRPGFMVGSALQLSYNGQLFLLTGGDKYGDGPRVFYETHRGELEWTARPWLSVWLGAGKSLFRERARTRTELDGGAGVAGGLWRLRLLAALSLRGQWAAIDAYDRYGGTLIGSATLPLGPLSLRARLVLSLDHYPDSVGYFDPTATRRDLLVKGGLELWTRAWHGMRAGLSYEVSHRDSTAELYGYTDHRVLLRLRWRLALDPWAPGTREPPAGHVELPYGVGRAARGGLEDERIQDLLRQEDAAQRGSSCID